MIWLELARRGWTDAKLAGELHEDPGKVSRLLYGDRKPGRELSLKLFDLLGTPLRSWDDACPLTERRHGDESGALPVADPHRVAS